MSKSLIIVATLVSSVAIYLPTRTRPSSYVSVENRKMRLLTEGSGNVTVVFENGSGGPLELWDRVQRQVSRFAKTVAYDRAGSGRSDDAPEPQDGRGIAINLHQMLRTAGIAPPYVLVGASVGGPYVRIYADMYADDVAALVLVDPTIDVPESRGSEVPEGVPVFLIDAISPVEIPFATATIRAQRANNRQEIIDDSAEYARWIATVPGGELIVTHRSGHNVAQEQPQLVVDTIRRAVDEVSRRSPR